MGLVLPVEKEARHVPRVDRLEHQRDAGRGRLLRGISEIAQIDGAMARPVLTGREQPGHHMDAVIAEHTRIVEGPGDAGAEFVLAAGQRCETPLARIPVAGRPVEQRLHEAGLVEPRFDLGRRMRIGEEILHGLEAVARSGGEALQERMLLIHHREVGGEFRHGIIRRGNVS
jgi:hypothetical protein